MKRIIALIFILFLLCSGTAVSAQELDNIPYDSYTYWQKNGKRLLVGSRAMFEVDNIVSSGSLAVSPFNNPTDISVDSSGRLYILDSGNSRLIIVNDEKTETIISDFDGEKFTNANGITISDSGDIYIADTDNKRILIGDINGHLKKKIHCPVSEIIPDDFEFLPMQMTVDKNDYLYVLCKGSYYGALVFAPDGTTDGFFGANKVKASVGDMLDTIWNRWFLTDEQRSNQIQKTPYQFSDLCMNDEGLLYTTTGALSVYSSQSGQIRCLGPTGNNVMKNNINRIVSNSDNFNFADEGFARLAVGNRVQNFISIDEKKGYIYALDSTYGKVFVYSRNCELLTVFGGGVKKGEQRGTFKSAVSIAVGLDKVYILDNNKKNIAVYKINDYGKMVQKALFLTNSGKYDDAKPLWEKVINLDRNNQLAYKGLAKAALSDKNYKEAMNFAKQGFDCGIYDQAFEYVRNDFLEDNFIWIFLIIVFLLAVTIVFFVMKKRGKIPDIKSLKLTLPIKLCFHPFDGFRLIKYNNQGSLLIATVLLISYYLSVVLKDFYTGFAHSKFSVETYNAVFTLMGSIGVVILWSVCNWAISVLAEGKGHIQEVYIVTCYSLFPQIVGNILYLIMSNILLLKEETVLTTIITVCLILTGILLCIGTMIIHEFDFFRFIWTAIFTLIAMAIVIFLCFMIVILLQQFYSFIHTVFIEVVYR